MAGKGKGRKRTASLINLTASKKSCSVDDAINNSASNFAGDSADSDGECIADVAYPPVSSDELRSCKQQIEILQQESQNLRTMHGYQAMWADPDTDIPIKLCDVCNGPRRG